MSVSFYRAGARSDEDVTVSSKAELAAALADLVERNGAAEVFVDVSGPHLVVAVADNWSTLALQPNSGTEPYLIIENATNSSAETIPFNFGNTSTDVNLRNCVGLAEMYAIVERWYESRQLLTNNGWKWVVDEG